MCLPGKAATLAAAFEGDAESEGRTMPRYLVECILPAGTTEADIDDAARRVVAVTSAVDGVRWVRSHLAVDRSRWFYEYEATGHAVLREAFRLAEIPCDTITEVREISPDAYTRHTW